MSGTTCAICLEDAKSPVSIPCGHIHCEKCLVQCVEACDDAVECPCPTCRAPFMIATPDLRFVPQKYHPFIQSTVRRVYPSPSDAVQALEERNETLRSDNSALKDKIRTLKARNDHLQRDKQRLMDACEANQAAVANYREMERQLRDEIDLLNDEKADREQEASDWERKYRELRDKYHDLKKNVVNPSKPSSSSVTAAKPAKRSSTQAALDASPERGSDTLHSRLILPIPKRPRLTSTSRKSNRNDMVVDDHEEQSFTERFNSGITSHSLSPPKPIPASASGRAASGAAPAPTMGASTSTAASKRKPLQSGLTVYIDALNMSVDVNPPISDDEEKDGPSKARHPFASAPAFPMASSSRSQAPSPPQPAPGPSRRPAQARPRAPPSPWDVFGSEEGSRGNLDFSLGSSSPGFPEELVLTDEEEDVCERERDRKERRERSYVFRGRRVQRVDE